MVSFSDIAVFILGTTAKNTRFPQRDPSYYESRVVPIMQTWGSWFPHLYFVFGTNTFDHSFLTTRCETKYTSHRRLGIYEHQEEARNSHEFYSCPVSISNTSAPINYFNVFYTANCTGEYFGAGPCCRCQESMRLFLSPRFKNCDWFLFLDDDVYIRPGAFLTFLTTLSTQNSSVVSSPVALISHQSARHVQKSRLRLKDGSYSEIPTPCVELFKLSWFLSQPAILNRLAVLKLKAAVAQQGMLSIQTIWGGSHDSVLGLLLWMHSIPIYSFGKVYSGSYLTNEYLFVQTPNRAMAHTLQKATLMFHRISNFKLRKGSMKSPEGFIYRQVVNQMEIARYVGDEPLYYANQSRAVFPSAYQLQHDKLGAYSVSRLIRLPDSRVRESDFMLHNPRFPGVYADYTPRDCEQLHP